MSTKYLLPLVATLAFACSGNDNDKPGQAPRDIGLVDTGSGSADMGSDAEVDTGPEIPPEPGKLLIDPTSITFSDVRQGETSTATVGISNIGGSPIAVTSVQIVEYNRTGEPEFVQGDTFDESFVVGPGLFKELEVVYEPKDFDHDSGRLEFFTDDPENEIVQIRLETVSAYAQLEGPQLLRFGDVNEGDMKTERLIFFNRGLDSLTIDSVDLGGITGMYSIDFELNATPPTVLERDEDFIVDVTYAPTEVATHRGTVTINSDAPDQPTYEVALVGNDPTQCLDITPDIADLGEIAAGSPGTKQVVLLNCSSSLALDVSAIELTDDGDGAFTLQALPTLPAQIAPLQTIQFTVSGQLAESGIATGEVTVTSNDAKSSGLVPLRLTVPDQP